VADAPKLHSAVKRQEIKVWTPEELRRFLELAADNRNHAACQRHVKTDPLSAPEN
jgi:hypothetical protein